MGEISDIIVNHYEAGYKYTAKELRQILESIVDIVDAYSGVTKVPPAKAPPSSEVTKRHAEPLIAAVIHSDDHGRKSSFQANRWFSTATDEEIRELAAIGWGYDLEADRIGYFMEAIDLEVEKVLEYCREATGTSREPIGFEVSVDKDQAMAWLRVHKPELWKTILAAEEQ